MAGGIYVGASGGVKIGATGGAKATDNQGKCRDCGCGVTTNTWPTTGWIPCTPCPGEPTPTKQVVASAATVSGQLIAIFGSLAAVPLPCLTGRIYDQVLGQEICVTCSPATGTIADPGTNAYKNPVFPTLQPDAPYHACCECRTGSCETRKEEVSEPAGGVEIAFAVPTVPLDWAESPPALEWRCCCPKPGANGVTARSSGDAHYYELLVPNTPNPQNGTVLRDEIWADLTWNLLFTQAGQTLFVNGTVRFRTERFGQGPTDNTITRELRLTYSCGRFAATSIAGYFVVPNPGDPFLRTNAFGPGMAGVGGPVRVSGGASVSCASAVWDITKERIVQPGSPGELTRRWNGTETVTYSGVSTCGEGCGEAEGTSASACSSMTYRGTSVPYPPEPMPVAIAASVIDETLSF